MPGAGAEPWAGRPLAEVLTELQTQGLVLIYSDQVVTPSLRIRAEPNATQPLERLQEALKPLGLTAKPVGDAGYAIVRETTLAASSAATSLAADAPLEEVTVYASRYSIARADTPASIELPHSIFEKTPGTEQDALRAIHYMPGTANNSLSALAHVRGGADDDTLVLFDGIELYNPVHLKDFQGLFGMIDPEFVQSLEFFSGGFPVRYGNHNAGVISIEPRHTAQTRNLLGVSALYLRAISSGSFDGEQGDWLLGYRRSSLPEVLRHLKRKIGDPEFEDFIGHFSYRWNETKWSVGLLRLNDDLRLFKTDRSEETLARYHDTYGWASAKNDWNDKLSGEVTLVHANLASLREGSIDVPLISRGRLNKTRNTTIDSLLTSWTANLDASLALQWGARFDHGHVHYEYASQAAFSQPLSATFFLPPTLSREVADEAHGDLYSAYLAARKNWNAWTLEGGLRWDDYTYIAHAQRFSPRINLRYALSASSSLRLSIGRFVQAQTLNNLDAANVAPQFTTPESSRQAVLGFDHEFANRMTLRVEAYRKKSEHVRPYVESVLDVVTLAPELTIDRGRAAPQSFVARGLEVSLNSSQQGPWSWWLNYSWSRALDRINQTDVPRSWDQPHSFAAGIAWLSPRWQHSAALTWHTGWPYTPLRISTNGQRATLGPRNSEHFGEFANLDLRSQYSIPFEKSSLEAFFELRNAFNRANDCCREVSVIQQAGGERLISVRQKSWLGIVPLAGINWRF